MRAADDDADQCTVENYNKNIMELTKEAKKRQPNDKTVKALLKETHQQRLDWIKTLPNGKIKPILEKCPVFEFGRYVSTSLKALLKHFTINLNARYM